MPDEFQVPVNHVQPKDLERSLKRSLAVVEREFPLQTGIIIFTFDFGPGGGLGYISNADRSDCIKMLEGWIAHQRAIEQGITKYSENDE